MCFTPSPRARLNVCRALSQEIHYSSASLLPTNRLVPSAKTCARYWGCEMRGLQSAKGGGLWTGPQHNTRAVTHAKGSRYVIAEVFARIQAPHPVGYGREELTGLCSWHAWTREEALFASLEWHWGRQEAGWTWSPMHDCALGLDLSRPRFTGASFTVQELEGARWARSV